MQQRYHSQGGYPGGPPGMAQGGPYMPGGYSRRMSPHREMWDKSTYQSPPKSAPVRIINEHENNPISL